MLAAILTNTRQDRRRLRGPGGVPLRRAEDPGPERAFKPPYYYY